MLDLPRLKPHPIPRVHPVPEFLAEGELKARYDEMKAVLRVPWMGVVTMSFAHYRVFYDFLWQGVRMLCASPDFTDACHRLRRLVEEKVSALGPSPLRKRLVQIGYPQRELQEIDESIETFSEGNFPYILLATLARLLLEGGQLRTSHDIGIQTGPASPMTAGKLVLMEYHHADVSTRVVFDDVKTVLGLPFLNTDYRALARWPSYFALAWGNLRPRLQQGEYETVVAEVHAAAVSIVRSLPNYGNLCSEALRVAARTSASEGEVLSVVRLFQWLLPGLAVNIAFFRAHIAIGDICVARANQAWPTTAPGTPLTSSDNPIRTRSGSNATWRKHGRTPCMTLTSLWYETSVQCSRCRV
jgi:hypothetical protein